MMRTKTILSLLVLFGIGVAGSSAAASRSVGFGAPIEVVERAYPAAAAATPDGRALIMPAIDIGGMHFDRVALLFDATHRLQKIRLSTSTETYEQVQAAMADGLASSSSAANGLVDVADQLDDAQIRICEEETGEIIVTVEQATISS